MKLKLLFLAFLSFYCYNTSFATGFTFNYTPGCHQAYQQYMSLNLDEGNALIRKELIDNPYNLMATYLADYNDCLLLLMNGDRRDYNQRVGNLDERMQLINKGDDKSPWFRLCKAGLYFHWALVAVRFGENFKAATTFRKSFLLLKENNKMFPDFPQNKIFMGVEEAVVGTIPSDYQWLAAIFGMKGNVKNGISKINSFLSNADANTPLRNEAVIFNCYLKFYLLSHQQEVWNYINSNAFPTHNNLLHSFVKANLALNFRKGSEAVQVLKSIQSSENAKQFPILDYEMGNALLHELDDNCRSYFIRFLSRYNGQLFVKDAYQKLAYAAYLKGDLAKANGYRQQILSKGTKQVDADKQAQRFAENKNWPPLAILQARLLTDGGYYHQALQKLQSADIRQFGVADKLEYYFWLARNYDETNDDNKALQFYRTTIDLGKTRQEHYAARSALQMGMLYERAGRMNEAVKCYNECLSMRNHDFQANIDQQAKAGVNRLTAK
jgi:hypothetical protein